MRRNVVPDTHDQDTLKRLCCGDAGAEQWATLWQLYVHRIDDLVDGELQGPEELLRTFALAPVLYTHPFFQAHFKELRALVLLCTNAYADSVAFERAPEDWKRQWADHYRHFAIEVVLAVGQICGGYEHVRTFSADARSVCHWGHHDPDGKPA